MSQSRIRSLLLTYVVIVLVGVAACSPSPTPIIIVTSTVILPTATQTPQVMNANSNPTHTATSVVLATPATTVTTLLESSVDPNSLLSQRIADQLASDLSVAAHRVQFVQISANDGQDANQHLCTDLFDPVAQYYLLLVGETLYEYHTNSAEEFLRCEQTSLVSGEILLAVDPLAAETFHIVQNLLATELDLSTRRIRLQEMIPVTWQDTSLGCPQSGQTYTDQEILGYHLVVTVGEQAYIYHSDANTAYPCPAEAVVLPQN